jgi:hypothetical protein
LIAWLPIVRVDNLVKAGAISAVTRVFDALWRRRLRRSQTFDKIINTNRNAVQAIKAAFWAIWRVPDRSPPCARHFLFAAGAG